MSHHRDNKNITQSNHSLIARRFQRAGDSYPAHAIVQHAMAKDLLLLAQPFLTPFQSIADLKVLEIGSGSGFLTEQLCRHLPIAFFTANDLYASAEASLRPIFQQYPIDYRFIVGDATHITIATKQQLIAAGAVLQWIDDKALFFNKIQNILDTGGLVLLSTFAPKHFTEIRQLSGYGLDYLSLTALKALLPPRFKVLASQAQIRIEYFNSPQAVLKHMQQTGVNALHKNPWGRNQYLDFIAGYEQFKTPKGYPLTYKPLLFILQKKP